MSGFANPFGNLFSSNTNLLTQLPGSLGNSSPNASAAGEEAMKDMDNASANAVRRNTKTEIDKMKRESDGKEAVAAGKTPGFFNYG
jgi:hypothetical protein